MDIIIFEISLAAAYCPLFFFLLRLLGRTKKEPRSYYEIWQAIGVDRPSHILFLTDVYQEATAAKAAGDHICLANENGVALRSKFRY